MDIARLTTDLDLMVEKINAIRSQMETMIAITRPTLADPDAVERLRALKTQIDRTRAGAIAAREAARKIAPKAYATEAAGL
ncbi:hypothetical protein K2Z83_15685 [Oscillochloris sp. ZM17-4]|uniref:hypothetical protein n=1 Tax=Oscillochloris sp. ZM17-4 TaxID=2866714 RepID=UPI001C735552|nr:hypothetical protein [Oscillochloris sp. ZM17-4]MBX0329119.1 hypothetical protein [Oscillochloris sp. ZM17-4]